jgi:hypothetical protein
VAEELAGQSDADEVLKLELPENRCQHLQWEALHGGAARARRQVIQRPGLACEKDLLVGWRGASRCRRFPHCTEQVKSEARGRTASFEIDSFSFSFSFGAGQARCTFQEVGCYAAALAQCVPQLGDKQRTDADGCAQKLQPWSPAIERVQKLGHLNVVGQ